MGFTDWVLGRGRNKYPVYLAGMFVRVEDEKNHHKEMVFKPNVRGFDAVSEFILNKKISNHNLFGTGVSGAGKTAEIEAMLNEVTNPSECAKYNIEPMNAVIFSPKHFDDDEAIDFDLGLFRVVDCAKEMVNPFEDVLAVKSSVEVMVANLVKTPGIMASHIGSLAGKVVEFAPCKDWDDFDRNLKGLRNQRNNEFNDSELNYLQDKIHFLKIKATIKDIPTTNCLFYLGGLQSDEARAFYYELYLQKLVRELKFSNKKTKPILVLDEGHIVVKEYGIMKTVLRELRTRVSATWCISQGLDDIPPSLLQFSHFPTFLNHHTEPFDQKPALRDCIQRLPPYHFIDWAFQGDDCVPVYALNKEYVDKLNALKQKALEKRLQIGASIPLDDNILIPIIETEKRVEEKVGDEESIVSILEKSEFYMTAHGITNSLGYVKKDYRRANIHQRTLPKMVKEDKIRKIDYITSTLKPKQNARQYYYSIPNGESQIHRTIIRDAGKVLDKLKIKYTESQVNQGWDIYAQDFCIDAKTGLQNDVKDDVRKLLEKSTPKVIFVCANYEIKKRYNNAFSVVDGIEDKFRVCCLNELEEVLKNWTN